jgi:hypothetical protein
MIDANNKQRTVLIAFCNLYGDHTGAAQAAVIIHVLKSFKITEKFHCFLGDNASNNNKSTIDVLNKHPNLNLNSSHYIRCAGHIINLVVKATVYGKGVSKFEEQLAAATPMDQFKLFRKLGAVGKLHNFVNALCASHKHREAFNNTQKQYNEDKLLYNCTPLQLIQDGGVRWHSVYLMLFRCKELQEPIKRFIREQASIDDDDNINLEDNDDNTRMPAASATANYNPSADKLTDEEWDEVEELVDFLQAPYEACKLLEGDLGVSGHGSIWQTLINLQSLWAIYTTPSECPQSKFLAAAIKFGKEKLDTYSNKLLMEPDVSYYAVALFLHPKVRLIWFKTHWKHHPKWYKKAEANIQQIYKDYLDAKIDNDEHILPPPSHQKLPANYSSLYAQTMAVDPMLFTNTTAKRQKRGGQLEEYIGAQLIDLNNENEREQELLEDPWEWWLQRGRHDYPILFKMATDFLSIPATSCTNEQAFSKARRTITCNHITGSNQRGKGKLML